MTGRDYEARLRWLLAGLLMAAFATVYFLAL